MVVLQILDTAGNHCQTWLKLVQPQPCCGFDNIKNGYEHSHIM
jgi:hypothetical protein